MNVMLRPSGHIKSVIFHSYSRTEPGTPHLTSALLGQEDALKITPSLAGPVAAQASSHW